MKPRPYQKKVIKRLLSIYETFNRAFLEMPTGTGKTVTALLFILTRYSSKKQIKVVWAVHQGSLVSQAFNDFLEAIGLPRSETIQKIYDIQYKNIGFKFMTWQSLRTSNEKFDFLVIDEVHCGSSITNQQKRDHKSFKAILKLAKQHLYISATPWNLNVDLFPGMMNAHGNPLPEVTAHYSFEDAKNDGFICNIHFLHVQAVNTLEISKSEKKKAKKFDKMDEGKDFLASNKVNLRDQVSKKVLQRSTLASLLDVVFEKEAEGKTLPPMIVYCDRNLDGSDQGTLGLKNVRKAFIKKANQTFGVKFDTGPSFIQTVNCETPEHKQKIDDFRAGKINILCVVGMAREGFNYPELEVVVDLVPGFNREPSQINYRLALQKIGRPMRVLKGKTHARYYLADTFNNYISVKGVRKEASDEQKASFEQKLAYLTSRKDVEVSQAETEAAFIAVAQTGAMKRELDRGEENTSVALLNQSVMSKSKKEKIIITEVGFVVTGADNSDPIRNIRVTKLFDGMKAIKGAQDPEGNKNVIKSFFDAKGKLPSNTSEDFEERRLAGVLASYCSKSSVMYDSEFRRWARSVAIKLNSTRDEECILFHKNYGVLPRENSKNSQEVRLARHISYQVRNFPENEFSRWALSSGHGERLSLKKKCKCMKTGEIYESSTSASLALGLSKSTIANAIYTNKRVMGSFWKYI